MKLFFHIFPKLVLVAQRCVIAVVIVLFTAAWIGGPPGIVLRPRSPDVNTNAYYFVKAVISESLAPIYFIADRESRLGSPVVVARGGVTNYVPLAMGIEYSVTSTVPITVVVPENVLVEDAGQCDGREFKVKWPLSFSLVPSGGGYVVEIEPFDPGGEYVWMPSVDAGGGLRFFSGSSCLFNTNGNWVGFTECGGIDCGCGGCSIDGIYVLEKAVFRLPSLLCGCSPSNLVETNEAPTSASVSVSFDKSVVFYEDAYTNTPNDVVGRRSTGTALSISAHGGETGGMLYISSQNMEKLRRIGGQNLPLPYTAILPPRGSASFMAEYVAEQHSDVEGDISVTVSFLPQGGDVISDSSSATVFKILLMALAVEPENRYRHIYGLRATVLCRSWPVLPTSFWSASDGANFYESIGSLYFKCPISVSENCMTITRGSAEYSPMISILEPTGVIAVSPEPLRYNLRENEAGGVGMQLSLYLAPLDVSFAEIAVEEIPSTTGIHTGYFTDSFWEPMWYHTHYCGAGNWGNVASGNFFMKDEVAISEKCYPPWLDGTLTWDIPIGWAEKNTTGNASPVKICNTIYHQTFRIIPNGTVSVSKFGYTVSRSTNDVVVLTGGE